MFTRRTATVIISAPDASCALTMTAGDEYLPVPTMSREENVLSAMVKLSMIRRPTKLTISTWSPSWTTVSSKAARLSTIEVVLDGDAARVDVELDEQLGDGQRSAELEPIAVQQYDHRRMAGLRMVDGPFDCNRAILRFPADLIAIDRTASNR